MTAATLERIDELESQEPQKKILGYIEVSMACQRILNVYRQWQRQDGPHAPGPGGSVQKAISQELDSTIRAEVDRTADKGAEVEPKAKRLVMALDNVARSFRTWIQEASFGHPTAPPRGSDALHNALAHLQAAMAKRNLSHPEPIPILQAQNASPQMIAIKYGWRREDGSADTDKVFEEMESPGTHYKRETWVHPADRAEEEAVERDWAARDPRPIIFPETLMAEAPKPIIPTLDELLAAKAPAPQIAALHNMSIEEVYALAADARIELDDRHIIPATANAVHQERIAAEEETQRRVAAAEKALRQAKVTNKK